MLDKRFSSPRTRAEEFANRLGVRLPILLAPMAGACPASLSIAVANAGGLGACGALLMKPDEIRSWSAEFRQDSQGEFQINLWIPEAPPKRDFELEKRQREFLAMWGPPVPPEAGDAMLPDFEAQCRALLDVTPKVISSIMGLYAPAFVSELKARGILWFANATTVAEAKAAEAAGADAIVAQGMEAGGHRGAFDANEAERQMVGLISALAAGCGCGRRAGHRCRRHCRWPCSGGGADPGSERGTDRNLLPAITRGEDAPCLRRQTGAHRGERNHDYSRFQRAAGRSAATAYVRAAEAPNAPRPRHILSSAV